jgi:hypothetical protein
VLVDELAAHLGQPNLRELIRRFLYAQQNLDRDDTAVALTSCPHFESEIAILHSATSTFYAPSDPSGVRGMRREVIRSTPCWRNKGPRRDCIFVERRAEIGGFRGLDVVRVLAFMSFVHDDVRFPCALVQWFSHVSQEPDELTGMWVVRTDQSPDGQPVISVIHTDSIFRGAHLIPVFGENIVSGQAQFSETLDKFSTFYVNRFIDHHAFEIIF